MALNAGSQIDLDAQYRAMREQAGALERRDRFLISVSGPEAGDYLQGQLTNDSERLEPGTGCYAALLDRKGRVQGDLRLLQVDPREFLLEAEAAPGEKLLRHLSMYKIGREVEVADRSDRHALLSLIGPRSRELTGAELLADEHDHAELELSGTACRAVATDLGIDLIADPDDLAAVRDAVLAAGAEEVSPEAAEILRVESGRPRFGREMGPGTMPAEAGIVERAIDFEKGCYIGQEPVARLHYRGRPNRVLRGLQLAAPTAAETVIRNDERELGTVGTAVVSPALGPIALAVLRREAATGDKVKLDGGVEAEVVELPFCDG